MELKYNFTELEYIDFVLRTAKKRNQKNLLLTTICLAVVFAAILVASHAQALVIALAVVILILFIFVGAFLQKAVIRKMAKDKIKKLGKAFFTQEKAVELTDAGLIMASSLATTKIRYENIVHTYQDDRFSYIEIRGGSKIFIPVGTSGLAQFLDNLKQKTGMEKG